MKLLSDSRFKRWRTPALVLLAAVVLLGNGGFRRMAQRLVQLKRIGREMEELSREQSLLREQIRQARSLEGIERSARRQLGYLKPGEIEYRFPPPGGSDRR